MLLKKAIPELIALLALFFGSWWLIARVDWVKVLQVAKVSRTTEHKLGELLEEMLSSEERVTGKTITSPVDSLLTRLCSNNNIDRQTINLHIIAKDEVNAFAMPGNHLVVYTGLIKASESPEQLAGVLAHEIAHLQLRHVMKKLVKEIGLSAVLGAAGGGELVREVLKNLSSSAYDRELEKEADLKAVQYLENADINAEPFARFLFDLASEEKVPAVFKWMSTHPDSEERAKYILQEADTTMERKPVLEPETWIKVKEQLP
jgi:predicted Zn-dependent protease